MEGTEIDKGLLPTLTPFAPNPRVLRIDALGALALQGVAQQPQHFMSGRNELLPGEEVVDASAHRFARQSRPSEEVVESTRVGNVEQQREVAAHRPGADHGNQDPHEVASVVRLAQLGSIACLTEHRDTHANMPRPCIETLQVSIGIQRSQNQIHKVSCGALGPVYQWQCSLSRSR